MANFWLFLSVFLAKYRAKVFKNPFLDSEQSHM